MKSMAIELMCRHHWREAGLLWAELDAAGGLAEREDYHAYARCCEVLKDWAVHVDIVNRGYAFYPDDKSFLSRSSFREAMLAYEAGCWRETMNFLGEANELKPDCWLYSSSYFRWHAFLMSNVSVCSSDNEKISVLTYWAYFKNANLFSRQAAGLDEVISLTWHEDACDDFLAVLSPVVEFLKLVDFPLADIEQDLIAVPVDELANRAMFYIAEISKLPGGYLAFLSRFFLMFGYAELYCLLRTAFIQKLPAEIHDSRDDLRDVELFYRIAYECEFSNKSDISEFAKVALEKGMVNHEVASKVVSLGGLYSGSVTPRRNQPWINSVVDEAFGDYIKGKRVAIVGPVDVGLLNGAEIDEFDVVIRFNHRQSLMLDAEKFGTRTDVSYYIYKNLARECDVDYFDTMNKLGFVVVDEVSISTYSWLSELKTPVRTRLAVWRFDSCPFLFGSPNAIQRVLMDVLRFFPQMVKVFNVNFFLNLNFSGGYRPSQMNLFPDFSMHDPFSNFIFTKKVVEHGLVQVDDELGKILRLSPDQYFSELMKAHSQYSK